MKMQPLANLLRNRDFAAGYRCGLRNGRLGECNYKEQPRFAQFELGWHRGQIDRKRKKAA